MGQAEQRAEDVMDLDFSMFTHRDLVNLVLQRSEILHDVPKAGAMIKAWEAGDPGPLDAVVADKGVALAGRAVQVIELEFRALWPVLDRINPRSVADIGCGYGIFDLLMHHRYGSSHLLIDVEANDHRHFGFRDEAAAYTSLERATEFLTANGVARDKITTWNPENEDPPDQDKADLAVSFLACGYHFPVDMYLPFFRFGVVRGGHVMLDIRGGHFQQNAGNLSRLGAVDVLEQGKGRKRVLLRKGAKG